MNYKNEKNNTLEILCVYVECNDIFKVSPKMEKEGFEKVKRILL